MSESAVYRPHPEAAAEAALQPEPHGDVASDVWTELRGNSFEFVSRGDFVSGMLHRPINSTESNTTDDSSPGLPLLLIQHGLGGHLEDAALSCGAAWAKRGLAVARIDLPLHGRRASPKLSDRLIEGCRRLGRGEELDLNAGALVEEFARQSTSDLIRTIDALSALPNIDEKRIGYMGFGLGAIVGSYLLAHDPRPSAVVFCLHADALDAKRGPRTLDAATYLEKAADNTCGAGKAGQISDARQFLFVAPKGPADSKEENLDALFKAAAEPKELHRFTAATRDLPKDTLQKIEAFLRRILNF